MAIAGATTTDGQLRNGHMNTKKASAARVYGASFSSCWLGVTSGRERLESVRRH